MSYETVIENAKEYKHETLFLESYDIGPDAARYVAESIESSEFTTLNLNYNSIRCEGVKYIADALKTSRITTLKIRGNNIKDEGIIYLADALRETQVTELDIMENNIENEIVQYLHDALMGTRVKTLHVDIYSTEYFERSMQQVTSFENATVKSVEIVLLDNSISVSAAQYINELCRKYPLQHLRLNREELKIDDVLYLSLAFKGVGIMRLEIKIDHILQAHGIQYLIYAFKASQVFKLYVHLYDVPQQWLDGTCVRNLMEFLREVQVLHLDLGSRIIRDDNLRDISLALAGTDVMYLDLRDNSIKAKGMEYLAKALNKSKLLQINLSKNKIDDDGAKYLADGLCHSQVTEINLEKNSIQSVGWKHLNNVVNRTNVSSISLKNNYVEGNSIPKISCGTSTTTNHNNNNNKRRNSASSGMHLCRVFQQVTIFNAKTNEFEFSLPDPIIAASNDSDFDDYIFLIRNLCDNPNSKAHLFHTLCRDNSGDYFDFDMMKKIDNFIAAISDKFGTFIDSELLTLVQLFDDYNYVNLVKELERMDLQEAVKNLLFHRVLYYVDENREILHPFIYKMLNKYGMPLYNKQIEPNKKAKIISYFQKNRDLDDCVQEIIDLLKSEAFV